MLIRLLIICNFAFIFADPILLKRRPLKMVQKTHYRTRQRPLCGPNPRPGENCAPAMCSIIVRSDGFKLSGQYATTCVPLNWKKLDDSNTVPEVTFNLTDTTTDIMMDTTTDTTIETTETTIDTICETDTETTTDTTSETYETYTYTESKATTTQTTANMETSTDSTTITNDQTTTTDKTTSVKDTTTTANGETIKTSSTYAPYDDDKTTTTTTSTDKPSVTEIRCNGRAICKDLLKG